MSRLPRVQFVSKPIAPPFHDGTKCLVRDVALNLRQFKPVVMSLEGTRQVSFSDGGPSVSALPVYPSSGSFAPALADNLRAALWLAVRVRASIWHFVFAPNPRSSTASKFLKRLRRVPVVQTVASPPRHFTAIERLLFGDVVVAQSDWTRGNIERALEREGVPERRRPRLCVIPPPVDRLPERAPRAQAALRRQLEIPAGAPLFVYPGDLEVSRGAESVAAISGELLAELPDAVVVFAYRAKTPRAVQLAAELRARLDPRVRVVSELPDVLALIASASAVLFPVDDLWGKVDLPIVLLESMSLGVPVVCLDKGPLAELGGVLKVADGDQRGLLAAALSLVRDPERARVVVTEQAAALAPFRAAAVAHAYEQVYLELMERTRAGKR